MARSEFSMLKKRNLISVNTLIFLIAAILFVIPFGWLKMGEMDLGGDTSRLYFFDPLNYLASHTFYGISPSAFGNETISYFPLPFITLLVMLKSVINSPTLLISFFNGIKLSVSFISIAFIVKELWNRKEKHELAVTSGAILAGLLYSLAPSLILGWDKAILTHDQIFLNPLIFLLLLKFFVREDIRYALAALILSVIFSHNFSWAAAPPFFGFYPIALLFLLSYVVFVRRISLPFKKLFIVGVLFALLHAFHIIPEVLGLVTPGSATNLAVFSDASKFGRGLSYFLAIAPNVKPSISLLALPQMSSPPFYGLLFIVFPAIIVVALYLNKRRMLLLIGLFFLVSLFFVTANITQVGFLVYRSLFALPGFSMFRNFFGQWSYLFMFFYALIFGLSFITIAVNIQRKYLYILGIGISLLLIINAIPFLRTGLLNKTHYQTKDIPMIFEMDKSYPLVLDYFRNISHTGKVMTFPATDTGYQMIAGPNGGVYQGPSALSYLAGTQDFTGGADLSLLDDRFSQAIMYKDYEELSNILSIFNVKYIFHNANPYIYDKNFPQFPYFYAREYMPVTQKEYKSFIDTLSFKKINQIGEYYSIYESQDPDFLPIIFVSNDSTYTNNFLLPYIVDASTSARTITKPIELAEENEPTLIEAENVTPINEIFNNYHLHLHSPFVSRTLDNPLYYFVVLREQWSLNSRKDTSDEYLDYNLLFLTKRIFELEQFGGDIPIQKGTWKDPTIVEIITSKPYYSWTASLTRYENHMDQLIDWVEKSGKTANQQKAAKFKIQENLHQHELKLLRKIPNTSKNEEEKDYLENQVYGLFDRLKSKLALEPYDPSIIEFSYSFTENLSGNYDVYARFLDKLPDNPQDLTVEVNEQELTVVEVQDRDRLLQLESSKVDPSTKTFNVKFNPLNRVENTQWLNSQESTSTEDSHFLEFGKDMLPDEGRIREIKPWNPNKQYVMTFDYQTDGTDVLLKFFDKRPKENGRGFTTNVFFEKNLNSKNWTTHQSVLTSHPQSIAGFLQILNREKDTESKIHIRNLSAIEIPNISLSFKKRLEIQEKTQIPQITFQKTNPTKYSVSVRNARYPYTLVFLNQFSPNWKVYVSKYNSASSGQMKSYFDGDVQELPQSRDVFNPNLIENLTKTPIAEDSHFLANGYANAWEINPSDISNLQNYELTIEYTPQTRFYMYLFISIITFIGVLGFFLYKIIKK